MSKYTKYVLVAVGITLIFVAFIKYPNPNCTDKNNHPIPGDGYLRGFPLRSAYSEMPICEDGYHIGSNAESFYEISSKLVFVANALIWFVVLVGLGKVRSSTRRNQK